MKNIKRHYPRIMMSAAMLLSSVVLLVVTVAYKAPPSLISSVIVIVLYFGSAIYYGLISIQSIVLAAAYIPSLAFLWAWLGGGNYINSHNHWLQDSVFFVDTSVALVAVSMMVTLSVLLLSSKSHSSRYRITGSVSEINSYLYLVSTILFLFFFWLTEPSLNTIFSSRYADVRMGGKGYRFAGALALIFWIVAFLGYSSHRIRSYRFSWIDYLFVIFTIISMLWLVLHARRSELLGIFVIWILVIQERYSKKLAVLSVVGVMAILISIGSIRGMGVLAFLSGSGSIVDVFSFESDGGNIVKLPGGMSNIFMTFVNTVHYFSYETYFFGETFLNYLLQILPSDMYRLLGIDRVVYFYDIFYKGNYSYNGGTYVVAPFYGNFGPIGMLISGLFIALYINIVVMFLSSNHSVVRLAGFFMIAILFRAFWYELISVIKPVVVVFIPLYMMTYLLNGASLKQTNGGGVAA